MLVCYCLRVIFKKTLHPAQIQYSIRVRPTSYTIEESIGVQIYEINIKFLDLKHRIFLSVRCYDFHIQIIYLCTGTFVRQICSIYVKTMVHKSTTSEQYCQWMSPMISIYELHHQY